MGCLAGNLPTLFRRELLGSCPRAFAPETGEITGNIVRRFDSLSFSMAETVLFLYLPVKHNYSMFT